MIRLGRFLVQTPLIVWPGFGTQPHLEALGDLPMKIRFRLECPKVGSGQPDSSQKIEEKMTGNIKKSCEQQKDYYKPIRVGNFWNNYYVEHESNFNKNKNL